MILLSRFHSLGLPALVVALSLTRNAGAQPACSDAAAQATFESALERYRNGAYEEALEGFLGAANCGPIGLLYQAQALMKLQRYAESLELLKTFVTRVSPDDPSWSLASRLAGRIESEHVGSLELSAGEPGASVTLDGVELGISPLAPRFVDAGEHRLRVEKQGFVPLEQRLVISAGQHTVVAVVLERVTLSPKPSIPAPGARPARSMSTASLSPVPHDGSRRGSPWPAAVAGGVTVAAATIGTIFGLQARSTWSEAETLCPGNTCADPADLALYDKAGKSADIATASFIVAGVSLVAGVALLALAP